MHLQRSNSCNQHHHVGPQTWRPTFDIKEFLHPDVCSKPSFSHWRKTHMCDSSTFSAIWTKWKLSKQCLKNDCLHWITAAELKKTFKVDSGKKVDCVTVICQYCLMFHLLRLLIILQFIYNIVYKSKLTSIKQNNNKQMSSSSLHQECRTFGETIFCLSTVVVMHQVMNSS